MSELVGVPGDQLSPRQRLVETAFRLFYEHGINAVGIDRVLAEAGVSKATLYRHFATKDGLIVEFVRLRDARYRVWLRERVDALGSDPESRILAVFGAIKERCQAGDFRGCAFGNTVAELADPDHPAHQAAREHKEAIRAYLAELLTQAGVREPEQLAGRFLLLIDGAVTTAVRDGSADAADEARAIASTLLRAG
ncbi:TetR/AcrR family transcriptional regulator [Kribbella sp. CA-294648]|uniref:TetR/AcrR family transcriptional regulator n=1 Tax=Kribbella sp. CA-294648 TaxID=3239948 RepID=UPI003D91628D